MQHFIWAFTVCPNTRVGVTIIQRVEGAMPVENENLIQHRKSNKHLIFMITNRPSSKSGYQKINFLISPPKHMLWVLKRTVSMRPGLQIRVHIGKLFSLFSVVPRARHCGIPAILPSMSLKNAPSAGLRARPRKFAF